MRKVEVFCNKCGKKGDEEVYCQDIHSFNISFHFGSKFETDTWTFDLCDDCLEEFVKSFEHPHTVNEW